MLTKANKGLENVGTLASLTTEEKTDLVSALNEVLKTVNANKTSTDKALSDYETSNDKAVAQNKTDIAQLNADLGGLVFSITPEGLLHVEEKEV